MKRLITISLLSTLILLAGCSKEVAQQEEVASKQVGKLENQIKQLKIENSKLKVENAKLLKKMQFDQNRDQDTKK